MIIRTLDYQDGSVQLEGYLAYYESNAKKPIVLVAHDWGGRRELACKSAEKNCRYGVCRFCSGYVW